MIEISYEFFQYIPGTGGMCLFWVCGQKLEIPILGGFTPFRAKFLVAKISTKTCLHLKHLLSHIETRILFHILEARIFSFQTTPQRTF